MSLPQIAGLELQDLIGRGSCGAVYRAVKVETGEACAVKVFSGAAINRKLMAIALRGLQQMPEHPGLPRPVAFDFDNIPYYCAMPLVGFSTGDGKGNTTWETPSLESRCGKVPVEEAWGYIYEVCDALAWLHRHNLVHCNLKPRNILVEDDRASATKIFDLVQGWIGVSHHGETTDHFMYLAPEQAEHPEALATLGTFWDVYSFGVLAYRLLTGQFPRASQVYEEQVQRQSETPGLAFSPDNAAILQQVRSEAEVHWPSRPLSKWDERRKQIIGHCLELDIRNRWPDLREVMREFEKLEADYLLEDAREKVGSEKRRQTGRLVFLRVVVSALFVALVAAVGYATWYGHSALRRVEVAENTITQKEQDLLQKDQVIQQKDQTIALKDREIQDEVAKHVTRISDLSTRLKEEREEKRLANQNLQMSQQAVDQFLTQLLQMPTGIGLEAEISEKQINDALEFYDNERKRLKDEDDLLPERARNYFNTAQLLLRRQKRPEAADYLEKAKSALQHLCEQQPTNSDMPRRRALLGRTCRWLGTLKAEDGRRGEALDLFKQAVAALTPAVEGDSKNRSTRFECASAWYELGKRSRRDGRVTESVEALGKVPGLMDAGAIGEALTSQEQFLLSRSRIEQGLAQRDVGSTDQAMRTLFDAMEQMVKLVERSGQNPEQAITLAEAYIEFGEIVAGKLGSNDAKEAHAEAMNILIELVRVHPQWGEARYMLGRNHGAMAALDRDMGKASEALRRQNMGVQTLAELVKLYPENTRYITELARLKGQHAQMLCDTGKSKDSIPLAQEAITSLEGIFQKNDAALDALDRKACGVLLAQLYGVLGYCGETAKNKTLAKASFGKASEQWEKLKTQHGADETIQQGLTWTKDRLGKIK